MPPQNRLAARLLATAVLGIACAGCYSGEKLVEQVRHRALRTRIDEVSLGSFRVTRPRDERTGEMTEVQMELFGESQRYKINEIEDELELKAAIIEDETIRTLREASPDELTEPDLNRLRERLLVILNETIEGAPLISIGFREIRFIRH
ncbi:hypothetical protein MalM25_34830 [Planctomycetes bacterium MalM25]|nr:hypothetical protein MalM25_34830 [Planctomycetes bacterium MalM25]